jgi:uncharacterized membrane protein
MRRREAILRLLRGEPLGVPSHAIVVHVPAALLPTGFLFELVGGLTTEAAGMRAVAPVLLGLGLVGGLAAAATGLLDWIAMIPGTARRSRATRHLVVQSGALGLYTAGLVARLAGDPRAPSSLTLAILALATLVLLVGNHLGGLLVYRDGMRVRTRP